MELLVEVTNELTPLYSMIVEQCMIKGGNYFLKNNVISMKADAGVGSSWGEAKL